MGLSCAVGLLDVSLLLLAGGFLIGSGSEGAVLALLLCGAAGCEFVTAGRWILDWSGQ